MSRPTVLVVEDDAAIRQGLVDALEFARFRVLERADGRKGLDTALGAELDLVLLDVILPEMDGFTILEELRRSRPTLPVIMLTARGAEEDRVRGLTAGADDYVVKPFSAKELLARVEAVLRRSAERPTDVRSVAVEGRQIDLERREVTLPCGTRRTISERESAVLRYLVLCGGRPVAREELLQRVWGINPRGLHTRTVDMHIARLREKIEDDPSEPRIIVTVRAKGYMFNPTPMGGVA